MELLEAMLTELSVGFVVSNQAAVGVTFQLAVVLNFEIIAVAPVNIRSKLVTLPTSQLRISWAKLVAPSNMSCIVVTEPVFGRLTLVRLVAPSNILIIVVTELVSGKLTLVRLVAL